MRQVLEKLLDDGRDDALLRFTLGSICLQETDAETALLHLRRAIEFDPSYSAAWKLDRRGDAETEPHRRGAAHLD